jgi:ATP-dependent Lon protease
MIFILIGFVVDWLIVSGRIPSTPATERGFEYLARISRNIFQPLLRALLFVAIVLFTFSGNDISKIDRVLLDRMVVVQLAGYQSKDKISIAEQFLLPAALKEVNLMEKVAISRDILQHVLETYAKEETGVREFKRCIEQIIQRVNMLRMFNVKELPFHIPNFTLPFVLKKEHVDLFLKKKDVADKVPFGMYT